VYEPVEFPAVTFCNLNNIMKSQVSLGGEHLETVVETAQEAYETNGGNIKRLRRSVTPEQRARQTNIRSQRLPSFEQGNQTPDVGNYSGREQSSMFEQTDDDVAGGNNSRHTQVSMADRADDEDDGGNDMRQKKSRTIGQADRTADGWTDRVLQSLIHTTNLSRKNVEMIVESDTIRHLIVTSSDKQAATRISKNASITNDSCNTTKIGKSMEDINEQAKQDASDRRLKRFICKKPFIKMRYSEKSYSER